MAKIKHNNFLDTVNDVFTDAIDEGVLHLYAEGESFSGRTIGVKNGDSLTYVPSLVGIDYDNLEKYQTYRQLLYQTIKRAIQLKFQYIDLGMTASFEKRKLGAVVEEKQAYLQTSDNYTLDLIGLLESR